MFWKKWKQRKEEEKMEERFYELWEDDYVQAWIEQEGLSWCEVDYTLSQLEKIKAIMDEKREKERIEQDRRAEKRRQKIRERLGE